LVCVSTRETKIIAHAGGFRSLPRSAARGRAWPGWRLGSGAWDRFELSWWMCPPPI